MKKSSYCEHKNIAKGSASPKLYEKIKKISLSLGMTLIKEKKLKSGSIQFRFEKWDEINA